MLETAVKSLHHSCRSELTRQGISLSWSHLSPGGWTLSWPTSVHLRGDGSDLLDAFIRQMFTLLHHQHHRSKLLEVDALLSAERVLDEEWDDDLEQVLLGSHAIRHPTAVVDSYDSTAEERLDRIEELNIAFVLHDGELREYLIARLHVVVWIDADMKTAFTVHEACDPSSV